jgi:hypothetical protein
MAPPPVAMDLMSCPLPCVLAPATGAPRAEGGGGTLGRPTRTPRAVQVRATSTRSRPQRDTRHAAERATTTSRRASPGQTTQARSAEKDPRYRGRQQDLKGKLNDSGRTSAPPPGPVRPSPLLSGKSAERQVRPRAHGGERENPRPRARGPNASSAGAYGFERGAHGAGAQTLRARRTQGLGRGGPNASSAENSRVSVSVEPTA